MIFNLLAVSFESLTGLPEFIAYVFVFVFGAMIGSFLNVVIHRVPNEESIIFPNSACPNCDTAIKAYDNIPILSWLMLRGKCRSCGMPISARYPAVELLTACLWLLVYWYTGLTPILPVYLAFVSAMVALIFIDAENMILPNVITYPLLVLALLVRIIFPIVFEENYFSDTAFSPATLLAGKPDWMISLFGAIVGALVGGGSLWLVGAVWKKLRGVDAMGLGDVKMMLGVGALLGWRLAFLSIFLGAFAGAVIGVVVIAKQKDKDLQTQIPFGIFLGTGSILSLLFGEQLINWYISTFVP
jgi:leader peptidase (prepilin peptidase)/N-methyltransferase